MQYGTHKTPLNEREKFVLWVRKLEPAPTFLSIGKAMSLSASSVSRLYHIALEKTRYQQRLTEADNIIELFKKCSASLTDIHCIPLDHIRMNTRTRIVLSNQNIHNIRDLLAFAGFANWEGILRRQPNCGQKTLLEIKSILRRICDAHDYRIAYIKAQAQDHAWINSNGL